jgi:hypothetical protein
MLINIPRVYSGGLLSNVYNNQAPLHSSAEQLLSRLFPQDQVSLSANAKLMLSIAKMLGAANGDGPSADRAATWSKLQELANGTARDGVEIWANGADPFGPGVTYAPGTTVLSGASSADVKGYERAVVSGTGGGDALYVMNDAVVAGGAGRADIHGRSSVVLSGGAGGDWIGAGQNSVISGGDGGDILFVGQGSVASGDAGNDVIRAFDSAVIAGGDGHDFIFARNYVAISGGNGSDRIAAGRDALIAGGADPDEIVAGEGSTIEGGAGDDRLYIGDKSRIVFGRGDGKDSVYGFLRGGANADFSRPNAGAVSGFVTNSTIQLRDVNAADITITRQGADLTIAINGSDDQMTIYGYSDKDNLRVEFADGTSAALADLPRQESAV